MILSGRNPGCSSTDASTQLRRATRGVKVLELGMGSSRFELRVSALAGFGARVFAVALIIRLNCAGSRPILERRARVHAAVRRS